MADFELAQTDCLEWLRTIESESVDLVVTDPAYESLEKHRAIGTTTRLTKDWFPVVTNEKLGEILIELYRVLKMDTHCYVYCDQETMHVLYDMVTRWRVFLANAPFRWWKFLVWEKTKSDGSDAPAAGMGYHYRASMECIVFLEKGKRRLNDLGVCDVLKAPRVPRADAYPTEKPVSVTKTLVRQSSSPGDLVLDPFVGSGSTGDASLVLERRFAGCDVSDEAIARARARCLGAASLERFQANEVSFSRAMLEGAVVTPRKPAQQGSLFT